MPKTNAEFWRSKIERNKARDEENKQKLKDMCWSVMTVWECQLKGAEQEHTLKEIEYHLNHKYLERQAKIKPMHYEAPPEYHDMGLQNQYRINVSMKD
jgi:DNA mismatch endonuclease (patch repair protein)